MANNFLLVSLNCRYSHSCLALFYVRHGLEMNLPGCQVSLQQFTINDPYYDTLLKISNSLVDALFVSVYIWNAQYVSRLVHDLSMVNPDRPIILGGPQASTLEGLPSVCTVVEGEFEGIGEKFYQELAAGNLQPVYTALSGNEFPFPYRDEDFEGELKNRQVYYESSRGCPFRCSYCLSSIVKKVGHKRIDIVKQELDAILAHEPKIIRFVDRTFNDNPARALEIWQYLASKDTPTRFHFEIAPDRFSDEMFDFLETVGPDQFQFEIGVQSTNPATLEAINRTMEVEIALENIARLVRLDTIHLHVDLILGLPHETRESFQDSFNRVFAVAPHYIQMGLLKVLPETPISKQTDDYDLLFCHQPPYQVLANRWLDHNTLSRLHMFGESVEAFYNNRYFSTFWEYLRAQGDDPFEFFEDLLTVSEEHEFFELSHTQELLTRILCNLAGQRADSVVLLDIIRYDWLRCGHRFLPPFLEQQSLAELRKDLRNILPTELAGCYDAQGRNEFIKRGVFIPLSAEALKAIGLYEGDGTKIVCFLPEKTTNVIKHNKAVCLEDVEWPGER